MAGGGGSKTITQTTSGSSEPWSAAQPNLKYGLSEAKDLYQSGVGFNPYMGSTVVPWSNSTMQGREGIESKIGPMQGGLQQPFQQISSTMEGLGSEARGDFSTTFSDALRRSQEDAQTAANLSASGAGRYGSAIHQGNVSREIGDLTNRAMLDRQKWANNQLLANSGALGGAFNTALMGDAQRMQMGGMDEDLYSRMINDKMRMWNESQNAPWTRLANFNAISSGAGGLGGSQQSTSQAPNPNYVSPGQQILGAALQIGGGLLNPFSF